MARRKHSYGKIRKVPADRFEAAISAVLEEYGVEVAESVKEVTKQYAKLGAKEVKAASRPFGKTYAGGWTSRYEESKYSAQGIIYNKTVPGLPHLLEHGHVTRNGTRRTFRDTPAHPHIDAAEKRIVKSYYENVVKNL